MHQETRGAAEEAFRAIARLEMTNRFFRDHVRVEGHDLKTLRPSAFEADVVKYGGYMRQRFYNGIAVVAKPGFHTIFNMIEAVQRKNETMISEDCTRRAAFMQLCKARVARKNAEFLTTTLDEEPITKEHESDVLREKEDMLQQVLHRRFGPLSHYFAFDDMIMSMFRRQDG